MIHILSPTQFFFKSVNHWLPRMSRMFDFIMKVEHEKSLWGFFFSDITIYFVFYPTTPFALIIAEWPKTAPSLQNCWYSYAFKKSGLNFSDSKIIKILSIFFPLFGSESNRHQFTETLYSCSIPAVSWCFHRGIAV